MGKSFTASAAHSNGYLARVSAVVCFCAAGWSVAGKAEADAGPPTQPVGHRGPHSKPSRELQDDGSDAEGFLSRENVLGRDQPAPAQRYGLVVRLHGGTGIAPRSGDSPPNPGFASGVQLLISANWFQYFSMNADVLQTDKDGLWRYFMVSVGFEHRFFKQILVSLTSGGSFAFSERYPVFLTLTSRVGWAPKLRSKVQPVVFLRSDYILTETFQTLTTLNFGLDLHTR